MIEKEGSDRVGGKERNKGIERVRSDSLRAIEELFEEEERGIGKESRGRRDL